MKLTEKEAEDDDARRQEVAMHHDRIAQQLNQTYADLQKKNPDDPDGEKHEPR